MNGDVQMSSNRESTVDESEHTSRIPRQRSRNRDVQRLRRCSVGAGFDPAGDFKPFRFSRIDSGAKLVELVRRIRPALHHSPWSIVVDLTQNLVRWWHGRVRLGRRGRRYLREADTRHDERYKQWVSAASSHSVVHALIECGCFAFHYSTTRSMSPMFHSRSATRSPPRQQQRDADERGGIDQETTVAASLRQPGDDEEDRSDDAASGLRSLRHVVRV